MEGQFSTDQSPQWAVVPMEEEEEAHVSREYQIMNFDLLQWRSILILGTYIIHNYTIFPIIVYLVSMNT